MRTYILILTLALQACGTVTTNNNPAMDNTMSAVRLDSMAITYNTMELRQ